MGTFAPVSGGRRKRGPALTGGLPPAATTALLAAVGTLLVALETTAALVALLAAGLAYGRFRRSSRLDDLLLALALGLLAETNLFFAAGPIAFLDGRAESFSSWATPLGQLGGALVLAVASAAPAHVL